MTAPADERADADDELDAYLLRAPGIDRAALNLKAALGLVTFGWMLVLAFDQLGRKSLGWLYAAPAALLLVGLMSQGMPAMLAAPMIYGLGWVHANRLLTRLERLAQVQVAASAVATDPPADAQAPLRRGALRAKVLQQHEPAAQDFETALGLPGGSRRWFNLAGVQACAAGRPALGVRLFERALQAAGEDTLVAQIEKNRDRARAMAQPDAAPAGLR